MTSVHVAFDLGAESGRAMVGRFDDGRLELDGGAAFPDPIGPPCPTGCTGTHSASSGRARDSRSVERPRVGRTRAQCRRRLVGRRLRPARHGRHAALEPGLVSRRTRRAVRARSARSRSRRGDLRDDRHPAPAVQHALPVARARRRARPGPRRDHAAHSRSARLLAHRRAPTPRRRTRARRSSSTRERATGRTTSIDAARSSATDLSADRASAGSSRRRALCRTSPERRGCRRRRRSSRSPRTTRPRRSSPSRASSARHRVHLERHLVARRRRARRAGALASRHARRTSRTSAGFGGTIRLLKNVMGLWLVQECRRAWLARRRCDRTTRTSRRARRGGAAAARSSTPTSPSLLAPGDMPARIRAACARSGQPCPRSGRRWSARSSRASPASTGSCSTRSNPSPVGGSRPCT